MARMPGAEWLGEHSPKTPMSRYDIVCIHTIVGYAPAHAAHFSTHDDGRIGQSRDTKYRSAANLEGNHRVIAIENEDGAKDVPLTDKQVDACAKILAWAHKTHGVPLQLAPNSKPGSRGLAYHRQGVDGNFGGYKYPGRVSGGEKWSSSFGKVCPRDKRIAQLPEILRRAKLIANPTAAWEWDPDTVSDLPIIQEQFQIAAGVAKGELKRYHGVAAIQNALNAKNGEALTVDGLCDAQTVAAWKRWETKNPGTGRATTPDMDSLRALQIAYRFKEPAPPKPPAKVTARIGIHNVYVKRKVAEVNQTYAALLAKHRPHAVLLQETAQMYGKWNIPGYKVIQFAPKRFHEGHVIETSSNTVLVRNDVAVEFKDLLDLTETWKGPKVGAMHDPRAPLAVTVSIQGKDLDLLDVHGPFTRDAVAEFNAEVAAWLKASRNPAVAGGDYNQEFAAVVAKIGTPSGALVDGQDPDMVATKGMKKTGSENIGKQGSDTHFFKIFEYEI